MRKVFAIVIVFIFMLSFSVMASPQGSAPSHINLPEQAGPKETVTESVYEETAELFITFNDDSVKSIMNVDSPAAVFHFYVEGSPDVTSAYVVVGEEIIDWTGHGSDKLEPLVDCLLVKLHWVFNPAGILTISGVECLEPPEDKDEDEENGNDNDKEEKDEDKDDNEDNGNDNGSDDQNGRENGNNKEEEKNEKEEEKDDNGDQDVEDETKDKNKNKTKSVKETPEELPQKKEEKEKEKEEKEEIVLPIEEKPIEEPVEEEPVEEEPVEEEPVEEEPVEEEPVEEEPVEIEKPIEEEQFPELPRTGGMEGIGFILMALGIVTLLFPRIISSKL